MSLAALNPRRVAILKPSALGDIVHALPVACALKARWPHARLTWVANRAFAPLLTGHEAIDEVLPFDRGVYKRGPLAAVHYSWRMANRLRRERFDVVIDLQGLFRTGVMAATTGAPVTVGFANAREGSRHFYTHKIELPDADALHAVERYWRVAQEFGATGKKRFAVPVLDADQTAVAAELADLPRPWVAVAAGARWLTKRWPVEHFAALLNRAHAERGASAILVGASDDLGLNADLAARLTGPARDLTGKTPLPRLAALLQSADAMLANDTGPLHLAAALGTPCVAPYTCTQVVRHGPYGFTDGAIETRVPCRGSYLRNCPNGLICFPDLTPDHLWGPLAAALSR